MLKLDESFWVQEIFNNLFFQQINLGFQSKKFFVDILPLGSRSVELQIFADPDSESQNVADPKKRRHIFPFYPQKLLNTLIASCFFI